MLNVWGDKYVYTYTQYPTNMYDYYVSIKEYI